MVPLRQVIAAARARLEVVPLSARGAHWRDAAEMLAIAEDAIRHSHALARRHIDIAEPFVAKAMADGDAALKARQQPSPDQES